MNLTETPTKLFLGTRVEELYHVGPVYKKNLNRLGIFNVRDLLNHFPFRYDDLSSVVPIIEACPNKMVTLKGQVLSISTRVTKNRKMTITEVVIADDTSSIKSIFFNQPYLTRYIKKGEMLILAGRVDFKPYFGKYLSNPTFEKSSQKASTNLGRIVPIYPETKGISSRWLRQIIKPLLKLSSSFRDPLPTQIKDRLDLINYDEAIRQIHFPDFRESLRASIRRLAFDELFYIALRTEISRINNRSLKSVGLKFYKTKVANFVKSLPFALTDCQRKAAWEIINDLGETIPMNRLLNGDVGSGKTIVAAITAFSVYLNNKQVAIMAPTEVLAYQHFKNFLGIFKQYGLKIELKTSNYRLSNYNNISKNLIKSDIIIGTHALIQKNIKFRNLALAIIDEQHRFGVRQRAQIKRKNINGLIPHLLSMTATPIPRTLSLSLYGDLDISILNELPQNRKKIKTYLIPPAKRQKAYDFVKKEIKKGRQIFVICPLIEKKIKDNSKTQTFDFDNRKAAIEEYNKLKKSVFPYFRIGLLHGRMKSVDKEKIMRKFKNKKIDILVSTSVVEVGVDIPNATVMLIEGADRFGLSQLHQFRGRVGRGKYQSYCLLFTDSIDNEIKTRLNIIAQTNDGFKIAEADLKLRGPGEIYGQRQHGLANLRFASIFDYRLIKMAREEAIRLVSTDPELKSYPLLSKKMREFEKVTHLE